MLNHLLNWINSIPDTFDLLITLGALVAFLSASNELIHDIYNYYYYGYKPRTTINNSRQQSGSNQQDASSTSKNHPDHHLIGIAARQALERLEHHPPPSPPDVYRHKCRLFTVTGLDVDSVTIQLSQPLQSRLVALIKQHVNLARNLDALCTSVLEHASIQYIRKDLSFSDYVHLCIQAMCFEECWDLLGHFQCIAMDEVQLLWIHKCVEDFRRSDQAKLCACPPPLFSNVDSIMYLLGGPGQDINVQIMAIYEVSTFNHEMWCEWIEKGGIDLMVNLVHWYGQSNLMTATMIVGLLQKLSLEN